MKPICLSSLVAACLFATALPAQDDELPALAALAEKFVTAYNGKKIDDILTLYTAQAEFADENDAVYAAGLEQIRGVFEDSFREMPQRQIALDVLSVRQVAEGVMVEEGIARFSGQTEEGEAASVPYSAILVKEAERGWRIASSREVRTEAVETDPLESLHALEGEWVLHADRMQMELAFEVGYTGRYLTGKALVSTPDGGDLHTDIRIGYDASLKQVRWWTFDELGGFSNGVWQADGEGWLVRTNGVTAEGEVTSAIQELRFESADEIVWNSTKRFVDGEPQDDLELRLVRRPPAPGLTFLEVGEEPIEEVTGEVENGAEAETAPAPETSPTAPDTPSENRAGNAPEAPKSE